MGITHTQGKPDWIERNNARDRVLLYWLYVLTSRRFYKNVNFLLLFPDLLDEMNVSQKLEKNCWFAGITWPANVEAIYSTVYMSIFICTGVLGDLGVLCRTPRGTVFMPLCKIYDRC